MAFLLATAEFEPCECCGSKEHSIKQGIRTHWRFCYHGRYRTVRDAEDDREPQPTHSVNVGKGTYSPKVEGWGKRWGRLPICPEHKHDTDEDWDGI